MTYSDDFRAYLKPEGSNPEINSLYYELASHQIFQGLWNCEVLNLGFVKGDFYSDLRFRPKDETKPIVFAIDDVDSVYFVIVDAHLDADLGMRNYKPFETDNFLVECQAGSGVAREKPEYWSIKKDGLTFVYAVERQRSKISGDFWMLDNCDLLCALVGGDITANELRAKAYKVEQEKIKEVRREERIRQLSREYRAIEKRLNELAEEKRQIRRRYEEVVEKLKSLISGFWPWIRKDSVTELIDG